MTERPIPPADASPEGASHNRRVPPLVWVIAAALVAMFGYMAIQSRNHDAYTPPAAAEAPK
jgi:hypothetical protein